MSNTPYKPGDKVTYYRAAWGKEDRPMPFEKPGERPDYSRRFVVDLEEPEPHHAFLRRLAVALRQGKLVSPSPDAVATRLLAIAESLAPATDDTPAT
jgi:hypothetical protein